MDIKNKLQTKLNKLIGTRAVTKDVIKTGTITNIHVEVDQNDKVNVYYMIGFNNKTCRLVHEKNVVLLKETNK